MEKTIESFFFQRLGQACRHRILRYCVQTSGDERRSIAHLFRENIEALSTAEEFGGQIDCAVDALYFLASDVALGMRLLAECADAVLNLHARILSHFLQRSWVEQEATLRFAILSLRAFVKYNWMRATNNVQQVLGVVARLVRRLMRQDLPTNVMLDCGVIVFEIDSRRNGLTSSLWLLNKCSNSQSVAFIALCYGAATVTSSRFFSQMIRDEKNTGDYEQPLVSLSSIMRSCSRRKNDVRYLLAVFKFFEILTRKIRFVDLARESHFPGRLVNFLWEHCDHFVDAIRALSSQCLKNAITQSDPRIIDEIRKILMETNDADERLCYVIVNIGSTELANNDRLLKHCSHLVSRQLKQTKNGLPSSWMTNAYVTLLTNADREEFDLWFDCWVRPVWDSSWGTFRQDVIVAAVTVCPQSLKVLIDMADAKQLNFILESILSIEDREVRRQRMNEVDSRILVDVAFSDPVAVLTFIAEQKHPISYMESLRASVDAIFCCDRDYQRRIFVDKFKNIAVDGDVVTWIQQRCFSNLFAGASFDRRHSALLLLGALPQPLKNYSPDHLRTLFACLADSYQENQSLAFQLLKPITNDLCENNQLGSIHAFLIEALFEANVSEHDTCAFVCHLLCYLPRCEFDSLLEYGRLFNLKLDLAVNENGDSIYVYLTFLLEIVKSRLQKFENQPLYGFLRVIRHIVEHAYLDVNKSELVSELAKTCVECNLQVLSVVSQSSPEGFLPPNELVELDLTNESRLYMSSQKALLRGWRTVKEASLLLKHLLSMEQLDENLMKFIGSHLKSLLFEVKHKGAIEVVYMAASTFCYVCGRSVNEYARDMPRCWLQEMIELIKSGDEGPICRWRRSAGIPFIVQAVLSTNSIQSDILCDQFAKQLLQIYKDCDTKEESKIHSANVLRVLFKNRILAQKVDSHMEMTLKVAIDGVASPSWNMRNVSWLLLGSVLSRSFELDNHGPNAISFFRTFPSLFDFFYKRLVSFDRSQLKNQSSVFAVLLLLSSFQPFNGCDLNDGLRHSFLNVLLPIVFECGGSPIWKIRITAVRAIRALVPRDLYILFISGICTNVKLPLEQNSLHGSLLQLEILLQHCCTSSSSEKRHLRKILIGFVADTNSILKSDKNSVLVKRQIFILRTLIFKKLNEWMLDDDETFRYFTTVGWPENSISVPTCFDDGTFIQSWIIHLVSHQLRANSNLDELEELLKHCLLSQPVIAVAVLEIFLQPTSSYLEENHSICLLRDYFLILPTDEQNRIIGCVRKSQSIHLFLNTFVRNCLAQKTYPFGGIRILSYLADSEFFASLTVDEIVSVCSMVGHDEEAFNAILDYVHRVLEFSVILWQNDLLTILRSVCTLNVTCVSSRSRGKQIALYDELISRTRGGDHISTFLDVWSQKLEFVKCEEPSSLDVVLRHFYCDSLSWFEPSACAVALVGWSLADIGIIWDRIESQGAPVAFDENLPARFENHTLLSRICSELLGQLLHSHTQLPNILLDKRLTRWLCNRCCISPAASIVKLVDVVAFFLDMRANLATSLDDCLASYLCRSTLFKRFAIDNIDLVISAFDK